MGGRIHGFLGGVLLTASLTYYTGEYFKKNSNFVSSQLKQCDHIINNRILSDKDKSELQIVDKRIEATFRPSFLETSKDIWNGEIIKMVNWVYSINWYKWGIEADDKISQLTDKVAKSISQGSSK